MPRFFLLFSLTVLAACAAWGSLVLGSGSWAEARALDGITRHLDWHIRNFGPDEWQRLRRLLGGLAGGLGAVAIWLSSHPAGRNEWRAFGRELRGNLAALGRGLVRLPRAQQRLALAALGLLTGLRLYFSLSPPLHPEEMASYQWFASRGLLAVGCYYPNPNNHVLANALAWSFHQLNPGFWFSMRLPVLLTATGATVGLFAASRRVAGFWAALLGTGLFAGLQLSWYFAAAGRGYWLVFGLTTLVLFATLALSTGTRRPRAAWAALLLGSLLGVYTIPAFAYPALAAWAWLGARAVLSEPTQNAANPSAARPETAGQRNGRLWALLALGLTLVVGAALLYAPLLLVSGWEALGGNGYVAARTAPAFWAALPAYLQGTEGMVAGQGTVGALGTVAVLAASRWWLRGSLPRLLTWWVCAPYLWLIMQRVLPPDRVLLYKSEALFLLVGLLLTAALQRLPAGTRRPAVCSMALAVAAFIGYQLYTVERLNRANRRTVAAYRAGWQWLARQPPGPALVPESRHRLYFNFYAQTEGGRNLQMVATGDPTAPIYRYVVAFPNQRGAFQPVPGHTPAFENEQVMVFLGAARNAE